MSAPSVSRDPAALLSDLPRWPDMRPLRLSDKCVFDVFLAQTPCCSDFEFANLWSWDVKGEMRVSRLNGNLALRFTDYDTGRLFYTFVGTQNADATARHLLAASSANGYGDALHLVPEPSAALLDPGAFEVADSPDHHDYVCDVARHVDYPGRHLKSHRGHWRRFQRLYPGFRAVDLDLQCPQTRKAVDAVNVRWHRNKNIVPTREIEAIRRFLAASRRLPHTAVGIELDGALAAYHIASLVPGTCAYALFAKADTAYRGIYAALDHVVAKDLLARGYRYLNIQQDLGLSGLRRAKCSLHAASLLRKFTVCLRQPP